MTRKNGRSRVFQSLDEFEAEFLPETHKNRLLMKSGKSFGATLAQQSLKRLKEQLAKR